eukprot:8526900-Karenia_brevis.AAC.1
MVMLARNEPHPWVIVHVRLVERLAALAPLTQALAALSAGRQDWLCAPMHEELVGAQEVHTRIFSPET